MDRDHLVGILLISIILITYTQFFFPKPTTPQSADAPAQQQTRSVTPVDHPSQPTTASAPLPTSPRGPWTPTESRVAQEVVLENEVLQVTFSSLGGKIKRVLLKKYQDHQHQPLVLLDEHSSHMGFQLSYRGEPLHTSTLPFETTAHSQTIAKDGTAHVTFDFPLGPQQYLRHTYTLSGTGYTLTHDWEMVGLETVCDAMPLQFVWHNHLKRAEKDLDTCRKKTTINYYMADRTFGALSEHVTTPQEKLLHQPIQWVAMKQRFFTTAIIAHTPFSGGHVATKLPADLEHTVKEAQIRLTLSATTNQSAQSETSASSAGQFVFYFGPNDYNLLQQVTPGFSNNISLGWPVVRWINQFAIIPLFTFLERYIPSYGLIIIVLVLIIKLLLLPLSYKSYMAMAKMRVLKPALDAIKAKYSQDTHKMQVEQMNFYRETGINPMSGCIPILLQMPILLAMFNFFPNAIALRQQPFLWASDLSTYDDILHLPFHVPAYGSHVSLFTLLMTASTILYARSSNQMSTATTDQERAIQMMTYIMPFTFMFILNSLPSGLSFYYFVSNLVTFGQQVLMKRLVDERQIKQAFAQRKSKDKASKKPRLQARLEAAQKKRKKL